MEHFNAILSAEAVFKAFRCIKPTWQDPEFGAYQALYRESPHLFEIVGNLHSTQQDPTDHISVKLYISERYYYTFHIYAFFPSYTVNKITRLAYGELKEIARFSKDDEDVAYVQPKQATQVKIA